jgi:formylglycine-generating enzyme required for sulfatase activity
VSTPTTSTTSVPQRSNHGTADVPLSELAVVPTAPAVANNRPQMGDSKLERDGLKYVWIPSGAFMMGCSPGDSECYDDEKPSHEVTISKGFWLGQTDVTHAAYLRVIRSTARPFKGDNFPATGFSWSEAQHYCHATGGRLPSEAEWEYAARSGSVAPRYGNLDDIAWYSGDSRKRPEVGQMQPNWFWLYDMLGNVWQWTADWYGENYYQARARLDPTGPPRGTERILRGGSWDLGPRFARASFRGKHVPDDSNGDIGFRCVGE